MATPQEFMEQIVDWPGSDGPGFVNLHWKPTKPTSPHDFRGKPFKELHEFMSFAQHATTKPGTYAEIYYCMASQVSTGRLIHGNPIAVRSKAGVLRYKCIWIDIDAGKGKGYATQSEAVDAVFAFAKAAQIPPPTAFVMSGGGVHAYWISDTALTKAEWYPYAHGLRAEIHRLGLACDAGLTTDEIRVLRVPGTFNNKIPGQPRAVRVSHLGSPINFARDLGRLVALAPTPPSVTATVTGPKIGAPPFDLSAFPKGQMHPLLMGVLDPASDVLGSGISLHADTPLDPTQLFKSCAHYRETIRTGGKGQSQGLWMQTVLGLTWVVNGREFAHACGNKYSGSTEEIRDEMYDRKLTERAENQSLGWPGCQAFENEGAKCKTCPFYKKLRSPLNLADRMAVPGAVVIAAPPSPPELGLPPGYTVDEDGLICEIISKTNKDEGTISEQFVPLFLSRLRNFQAQSSPRQLVFETSLDLNNWGPAYILEVDLTTEQSTVKRLRECGVKPNPRHQKGIVPFMTSFMAKLDKARKRDEAIVFGWFRDPVTKKPSGFAYGGEIRMDDGTTRPAGIPDPQLAIKYMPQGDASLWLPAARVITNQNRPGLEVITAVSFAAPLMFGTGKYNCVLCPWSPESGIGKSTAAHAGLAVWGSPKSTKETPQSSSKGLIHKLGSLKNLPVYWDEISKPENMDQVSSILGSSTEGTGGVKLHADRTFFETDQWQTLMVVCANQSLVDNILRNVKGTNAPLQRVFEYKVEAGSVAKERALREGDVSRMFDDLNYNYGHVGVAYRDVLGRDPDGIKKFVASIESKFDDETGGGHEERFRRALAACTFAGAKLANDNLGTEFHLDDMWAFLKEEYARQTNTIASADVVAGTKTNTANWLTHFFKAHTQAVLWVGRLPHDTKKGKPGVGAITHLGGPNAGRPGPVHIRMAVDDRFMDVSRNRLEEFLFRAEQTPSTVINGLIEHFDAASISRVNLAYGAGVNGGQETILRIPVRPGSPFVRNLYTHTPLPQVPADMVEFMQAEPQEVGESNAPANDNEPLVSGIDQAAKDLALVRGAAA